MGLGPHGFAGLGPREQQKNEDEIVRITPLAIVLLLTSNASAQDAPALTPRSLEAALASRPQAAEASVNRTTEDTNTFFRPTGPVSQPESGVMIATPTI